MKTDKGSLSKTVAVFGAGGFIGSHIVEALLDAAYNVMAIDIEFEKLEDIIAKSNNLITIHLDIAKDPEGVEKCVRDADVIVDLVAYANPSIYVTDPVGTVELNLFENLKIADLCVKHGKFLIQYSSCEVYGINNGRSDAFNEDSSLLILGPINEHRWIYSCAKQTLERIVHAYGLQKGLDYIIVRPFNFVGPRIDYLIRSRSDGIPRVFSHFMSALLLDQPLPCVNGGCNLRSYTYIDDALDAFFLILENREILNRQIVNIGNPNNETSIKGLAHLMITLYEEQTGIKFTRGTVNISGEEFYGEGYADCDRRIPDTSKLYDLGWRPKHDLESTFRKTIQYYLDNNELVERFEYQNSA
jgi:nucleoside-diphosphate-sugar epimerase